MKKIVMVLVVLLGVLLLPVVYAQIPWDISDLRCGNGVRDRYELCEKKLNNSLCEDFGKILKVASNCDDAHCTCVPRVLKAYCGNNRREGIEVCDGNGEDKCSELGALMNVSLKCNPSTCGCAINESIPTDYSPKVIAALKNLSQVTSVCGDKKVERDEECDPPNTLCTTSTKEPGVCTQKCRCVKPQLLSEPTKQPEGGVEKNKSVSSPSVNELNASESLVLENTSHDEKLGTEVQVKPRGFFARMWDWIMALFS